MKILLPRTFFGILFCKTVWSADICLMLTPSERIAVSQAQAQAHKQTEAHNSRRLCLNGIIYTNEGSWTIWINGRSIKPGEYVDGIRILNVTPDSVEIVWKPKPQQQHQIILRPGQIFYAPSLIDPSYLEPAR